MVIVTGLFTVLKVYGVWREGARSVLLPWA
jgi:hypothetical protein